MKDEKEAEDGTLFSDSDIHPSSLSLHNSLDIGFRALKIDSSNMADVYYTPDAIEQGQLKIFTDNIKPDRKPEDLLFQVLLDWGVDLSLPIRKETIQGKTVFFVNELPYDLVACFDTGVNEDLVKELARFEPLRVVFRDSFPLNGLRWGHECAVSDNRNSEKGRIALACERFAKPDDS